MDGSLRKRDSLDFMGGFWEEALELETQDFLEKIKETFPTKEQDIRTYSPLALAFIGDGIYEAVIRTMIVRKANRSANELNKMKVEYVKAPAQAAMVEIIKPMLTEAETDVLRRGRNASPHSTAKNASLGDYHKATGFEALVGYLYLSGQTDRMLEIIKAGVEGLDAKA